MFKKIQQNLRKKVELPSTESPNRGVLNGRALTNTEEPTNIKIESDVATARISNQQSATDSSKMFDTIKLERAPHTTSDPVELFIKAIKKNPCCANDYVVISQKLFEGNFSDSSLAFYCIKKGRLAS